MNKILMKYGENIFDNLNQTSMAIFYEKVTKEEFLILEMNRMDQRYPEIASSILVSLTEKEKNEIADLKWIVTMAETGVLTVYGHCIKTNTVIPLNPFRPMSYSSYKKNKNDPIGCYCHYCGKQTSVYIDDPFCEEHEYVWECFKKKRK